MTIETYLFAAFRNSEQFSFKTVVAETKEEAFNMLVKHLNLKRNINISFVNLGKAFSVKGGFLKKKIV